MSDLLFRLIDFPPTWWGLYALTVYIGARMLYPNNNGPDAS